MSESTNDKINKRLWDIKKLADLEDYELMAEITSFINKSKIQEKINTIRVLLLKGMVYEQYVAPLEKRLEELKKEL